MNCFNKGLFKCLVFLILSITYHSRICYAANVEYSYGIEADYTDNVALSSANEESDVEMSALAGFAITENAANLEADLRTLVEYSDYLDDSFADDTWFYLSGEATWTIRPSSFFWTVENYYSRLQRDVLTPGTPDNYINSNVFSTGPDLYFRINPVNRINFGIRGDDYRFEDTNADSERGTVRLAWLNSFTSNITLSINYELQKVEFTELDNADFDRQDLFFRIDSQHGRSFTQLSIGVSNIERDQFEDVDGELIRLVWRNQFRQQSYFQIDAYSQFTDNGLDLLNSGSTEAELDLAGSQVSGDIFLDKRFEFTYHLGFGRSTFEMRAFTRDEDYEVVAQDRKSNGVRLTYDYIQSSLVDYNFNVQYRKNDNIDVGQLDKEKSGGIAANFRLTRKYTLRLSYNHITQESSVPSSIYNENRLLVSFYYGRAPESYR